MKSTHEKVLAFNQYLISKQNSVVDFVNFSMLVYITLKTLLLQLIFIT